MDIGVKSLLLDGGGEAKAYAAMAKVSPTINIPGMILMARCNKAKEEANEKANDLDAFDRTKIMNRGVDLQP